MYRKFCAALVLTGSVLCSPTAAGELSCGFAGYRLPDCVGKWCCPDYCRKPEPCVCAPLGRCCDDYCPKRAPCVCVPLEFCCDNYCPKCPPSSCTPAVCESLTCGPPRSCYSRTTDSSVVREVRITNVLTDGRSHGTPGHPRKIAAPQDSSSTLRQGTTVRLPQSFEQLPNVRRAKLR
jgi:hypothetical protein